MLNKRVLVFLFFLMTITFFSCQRFSNFELDYEGDKIVVRGTISPDRGVEVVINRSLDPSGSYRFDELDDYYYLNDAQVFLYEDGVFVQQLIPEGEGVFRSVNLIPTTGKEYHLEVQNEGLEPVSTAKIQIPSLPEIIHEWEEIGESAEGVPLGLLTLSFDDTETANYYEFSAFGFVDNEISDRLDAIPQDARSEEENLCGYIFEGFSAFYLKDDCFENIAHTIPIEIESHVFDYIVVGEGPFNLRPYEHIDIQFRATTEAIYEYKRTSVLFDGFENAFFEPPVSYTNIIGGYGYFGAYNEWQTRIEP